MAVACPSSRVTTARRGLAGGCGVRRARARCPLCASVPCRRLVGPLPGAARVRGSRHVARGLPYRHSPVSPAASTAGGAWCGDAGVSGVPWSRLVAVALAAASRRRCEALPTACPPPGAASGFVPGVRRPAGVASGSQRWVDEGGRALGARRGCPCRLRRRGPVRRRPAGSLPCAERGVRSQRMMPE